MKYLFLFFVLLVLGSWENEDSVNPTNGDIESVTQFLYDENGLVIVRLADDEDDETYYFDSYVFNFASDGSVVATDNDNTVNRTYSVFTDDGRIELIMSFPNINNFNELNDDWYFISINAHKIKFDDDGDVLEFQQQ
jgi:hypothetical protein